MFFAVRFISCIPLVAAVQLFVHVYFNKFLQQCKMKTSRQTSKKQQNAFTPTLGMAREYSKVCVEWAWIVERLPVFLLSMEWVSDKVHILLIPVFMCPASIWNLHNCNHKFCYKTCGSRRFSRSTLSLQKGSFTYQVFFTERKCALSTFKGRSLSRGKLLATSRVCRRLTEKVPTWLHRVFQNL